MWFRNARRRTSRSTVDEAQWRRVEEGLPFLHHLDAKDRQRLRELALRFLGEKELYGAHGMELSNEVRLSIALQACLPILNLGLEYYAGWVGIVVYPGDFIVPREVMDEHGVVHQYQDQLAGEAWEGGPVLLSWFDEAEAGDGMNVVIHEFAHKIDMLNGAPDGLPPLHADMDRRRWAAAFKSAYEDFCRHVEGGEETAMDPYGAEHPAEFFAVASEMFFEAPELLLAEYPAVYEQLHLFYRQDPAARIKP